MALQQRERVYEVLARIDRGEDGSDRVVGMHVQRITEVVESTTGAVIVANLGPAEPLTWAGLVDLMHEDDKAALAAAMVP